MKHLRIVLTVAVMAFAAFGYAAAQDATATPLPETAAPEATAVPETGTTDAAPSPFMGIQFDAAENGVVVVAVASGSPAETAGIQAGDIVTAINGQAVTEDTVRETVQGFAVGDTVTVDLTRGEESLSLDVTLVEAPADVLIPGRGQGMPGFEMFDVERPRLGISIGDSETGVVVNEVAEGSPAQAAGLQVGDIVTAINGEAVATPEEAAGAVAQAIATAVAGEFDVTVSVTRGEESLELVATLVKPETPAIPDMPGFGGPGRNGRGFGGMGMGGFNLVPREGEEGAFDLVVPFRPADPAAVTDDVTAALADLGIRIVPREGEDGLFDLYVPAETLGETEGGFILPHLDMFQGMMPDGFEFHFGGPMGRGFNFEIPAEPTPQGDGSA